MVLGSLRSWLILEIQVAPVGVDFDAVEAPAPVRGQMTSPGGDARCMMPMTPGAYHWRARAVTSITGARSAWTSFGDNPETDTDFVVTAN